MSGIVFKANTAIDTAAIANKYNKKLQKIQAPLDSLIMADSNYFCPLKTGKLQQSVIINSKIGSGVLIWRTPYARRQYYDYHKPPYQPNPNACGQWVKAAKARWFDKWVRFVDERI